MDRVKKIIKLQLLIICGLLTGQRAAAQKFNTDAVNKFWHIVDLMKADKPLTDSVWKDYYNLYGNKTYMENNRSAEQSAEHRKYLEFVFRPSMSDSLKSAENVKPKEGDDILKNLLYLRNNEKDLRAYTRQITSPAYLANCIALAKTYLPQKINTLPNDLTIYINAMTFDAAVQSPDMYFGLSIIYEFDKFRTGAIAAHEFHHQLRVSKAITGSMTYADSTSCSIISQVNNEGTADLIDKTIAVKNKNTLYDADGLLHWLFDDAPKVIRQLDSCFIINAGNGPDRLSYRDFRKLTQYSSGHIPGFYMAAVIMRNGGNAQLIAHEDNPFKFFFLYQQAATKDKKHPPIFSAKSIAYLKELQKRAYNLK